MKEEIQPTGDGARSERQEQYAAADRDLLAAMRLFDTFPLIALQRAISADGSCAGYRCSIPLYANDPDKAGQLIATVNGDGTTAAEAIYAATANMKARTN